MHGKIPLPEMQLHPSIATEMADQADVALITIGRNAGEGGDRKAEPGDFYLTETEQTLIKTVTEAFQAAGKQSVVILNIAGVIEMESWKDIPDAVLCAWLPGQEAGNSVTDVLTGKVNPSGKLAVSFPKTYEDAPTAKNFPGYALEQEGAIDDKPDMSGFSFMQRNPWEVIYEEDIYVGYRYYGTFNVPVTYEFGYGKSYTTFNYSNLQLSTEELEDTIKVSLEVMNTGIVAGREVVQLYASAPNGKIEKPRQELIAFDKTRSLAPGETETISFVINAKLLASFHEEQSCWVAEAGTYSLQVGASCADIRAEAAFAIATDIITEITTKSLVPQQP